MIGGWFLSLQKTEVSVFEMSIRFLGGLLTAYIFTKDKVRYC